MQFSVRIRGYSLHIVKIADQLGRFPNVFHLDDENAKFETYLLCVHTLSQWRNRIFLLESYVKVDVNFPELFR